MDEMDPKTIGAIIYTSLVYALVIYGFISEAKKAREGDARHIKSMEVDRLLGEILGLPFRNEHISHLEYLVELSELYGDNEPHGLQLHILIKFNKLYDKLMDTCSTERWNALGEYKKAIVEALSDKYDKDQENLIHQ